MTVRGDWGYARYMSALPAEHEWSEAVASPSVVARLPADVRVRVELYVALAWRLAERSVDVGVSPESLRPAQDLVAAVRLLIGRVLDAGGVASVPQVEAVVRFGEATARSLVALSPDPVAQRTFTRVAAGAARIDASFVEGMRRHAARAPTPELFELFSARVAVDALTAAYVVILRRGAAAVSQRAEVEASLLACSEVAESKLDGGFDAISLPFVGALPPGPPVGRILSQVVPAETFLLAAKVAFAHGERDLCRQTLADARTLHPDDEPLRTLAEIVAPPVVRVSDVRSDAAARDASLKWADEHAGAYRGQWLVMRAGTLVGAAPRLADLRHLVTLDDLVLRIPS